MTDSAVRGVLVDCLAVRSGESVLVVTDPATATIARSLVEGARELGAETMLMEMSEREQNGTEPPDSVAAAMLEADVVIAPTTKSLSHTEARHAASTKGARIASMPGVTEDMMTRTMNVDWPGIVARTESIADLLTAGNEVRIESEAGTDVVLVIEGRTGLADHGRLQEGGSFGNLPAGEGFVAPVEGKTNGRIVFDGSMSPMGPLDEPLILDIEDGYARHFSGPAADDWVRALIPYGDAAFAVAELGIGANEAAILTGNILEDEKILGTIHVAFGDNHSFGGTNRVQSHHDGIVLKPTLTIDGKALLTKGRLLV